MTRDLHPTEGARYLLELAPGADASATSATYRAVIYTPAAEHATEVVLTEDGSVTLGTTDAPPELADRLVNMAKLMARDARKRRDDGLPPWPARVLRWRK